jgi:hypothetical protein
MKSDKANTSHHLFRLLTLLTSACLMLPPLLNKALFSAGADESVVPNEPALSLGGEKFGSVIVLGEIVGLVQEASLETARAGMGRMEALVFGRRISRRSGCGI